MKRLVAMCLFFCVVFLFTSCKHEHSFGEWETTEEPTCISEGSEHRTCECGEEELRTIPISKTHDYDEYGFCRLCNDVSNESIEDLDEVVKVLCWTYWFLSYNSMTPEVDDIHVRFDSISHDLSMPSCGGIGSISVDYNGYTFISTFDMTFVWKDDDNGFVRDDGTCKPFFACDPSGEVITEIFPEQKVLTSHVDYDDDAKSILEFDVEGNVRQTIYDVNGNLISDMTAVYDYVITPNCWVITLTTSSGHKEEMQYYPDDDYLIWDTYLYY